VLQQRLIVCVDAPGANSFSRLIAFENFQVSGDRLFKLSAAPLDTLLHAGAAFSQRIKVQLRS
jgi:hypothetical protein